MSHVFDRLVGPVKPQTLTAVLGDEQFYTMTPWFAFEISGRILAYTVHGLVLFVVLRGDGFVCTALRKMQRRQIYPSRTVLRTMSRGRRPSQIRGSMQGRVCQETVLI